MDYSCITRIVEIVSMGGKIPIGEIKKIAVFSPMWGVIEIIYSRKRVLYSFTVHPAYNL
jgi:hypothetical protein